MLVWLKLIWGTIRCLAIQIAVRILTLIKLKEEAGQRQHYIVGVTIYVNVIKTLDLQHNKVRNDKSRKLENVLEGVENNCDRI